MLEALTLCQTGRHDAQVVFAKHQSRDVCDWPAQESSRPSGIVSITDVKRAIEDRNHLLERRTCLANILLCPLDLPVADVRRQIELFSSGFRRQRCEFF